MVPSPAAYAAKVMRREFWSAHTCTVNDSAKGHLCPHCTHDFTTMHCTPQARLLAAEAQAKFLTGMAAPLPRSLDKPTLLPVARVYGPDIYSSALGGASLMLQLLRLYVADPVASAQYLKAVIRCTPSSVQVLVISATHPMQEPSLNPQ